MSEQRLKYFIENAADAIYMLEIDTGRILDCNFRACLDLGYSKDELVKLSAKDIEFKHTSEEIDKVHHDLKLGEVIIVQGSHKRKDGSVFPVEIRFGSPITSHPEYIIAIARDMTERKRAEEALKASLSEKEILLKEVHHRVKNNLAIIIGLIDLQRQEMSEDKARAGMAALSVRIMSMALVHEQLYQSESLSRINYQGYLETLIAHLHSSYDPHRDIRISVFANGVEMSLDHAIPCGFLITELVTNALKYAFPEGWVPETGSCEIAVSAEWDGTSYTLTVADNGVGLPDDLEWTNTKTLGLLLIKMLGQHQLQGQVELDHTAGTTFRLRFAPRYDRMGQYL